MPNVMVMSFTGRDFLEGEPRSQCNSAPNAGRQGLWKGIAGCQHLALLAVTTVTWANVSPQNADKDVPTPSTCRGDQMHTCMLCALARCLQGWESSANVRGPWYTDPDNTVFQNVQSWNQPLPWPLLSQSHYWQRSIQIIWITDKDFSRMVFTEFLCSEGCWACWLRNRGWKRNETCPGVSSYENSPWPTAPNWAHLSNPSLGISFTWEETSEKNKTIDQYPP